MVPQSTILIVDDEPRNIYALKAVLRVKGYKILTANDGREGIALLEDHPEVDIMLLDMMMPEMDGYEALAELRSKPQYKDLPIIAVTAKAMTGDREKCLEAGATDYLPKPIDDEKLFRLIEQYIRI